MPEGRPPDYDEPVVKRHFDIPESLNRRLVTYSKRTKKPAVRIVQDALERVLPSENQSTQGQENAVEPQGEGSSNFNFRSEMEGTLRAVLSEILVESVPVSVDRVRRKRLKELAKKLGFANEQELARDLVFRAIENPNAAESFLFSDIDPDDAPA